MGKIQNEDIKSSAELVAAGGTAAQLPNDTKVYITANSINDTLYNAIGKGLIGGGGGSKNYLTAYTASTSGGTANTGNGDFEQGTTNGWSLAHTALTSKIPTSVASAGVPFDSTHGGTAASGNLSFSVVTSNTIQKANSGSLVSSTSSTAGDLLISSAFYIDAQDQAKVLSFKFSYQLVAGSTVTDFSGTSANTFAIYIYDVTAGAWIQPAGVYNFVQKSGVGTATGTFQTTSSSTRYQIAIVNITASTGTYTLYVDDFSVGPQVTSIGPAMSDWTAWTPTGSWTTNTVYSGVYKRVGDVLWGQVTIQVTGVPTNAALTVNLPSGLTIDNTKIYTVQYKSALGWASAWNSGQQYPLQVVYDTTTSVRLLSENASGTYLGGNNLSSTSPVTWANTDTIEFYFQVPIVGWSSNTVQSSDTDMRVVAASGTFYNLSIANGTLGTPSTILTPSTKDIDTHAAYSGNSYYAPVSGYYEFSAAIRVSSLASTASVQLGICKNSSNFTHWSQAVNQYGTSVGMGVVFTAKVIYLNAGDYVRFGAVSDSAGGVTTTFDSGPNIWSIKRISGPAVVQASETVAAKYGDGSGQQFTVSGAFVVPKFPTKFFDTHSAFNVVTGEFTCPTSGIFAVNAVLAPTTTAASNCSIIDSYIRVNGVGLSWNRMSPPNGTNFDNNKIYGTAFSTTVKCVAGDKITIAISPTFSGGAGQPVYLWTDTSSNSITITRVGN